MWTPLEGFCRLRIRSTCWVQSQVPELGCLTALEFRRIATYITGFGVPLAERQGGDQVQDGMPSCAPRTHGEITNPELVPHRPEPSVERGGGSSLRNDTDPRGSVRVQIPRRLPTHALSRTWQLARACIRRQALLERQAIFAVSDMSSHSPVWWRHRGPSKLDRNPLRRSPA